MQGMRFKIKTSKNEVYTVEGSQHQRKRNFTLDCQQEGENQEVRSFRFHCSNYTENERKILNLIKNGNQVGFQEIVDEGEVIYEGIPRKFLILNKLGANLTEELSQMEGRVLNLQKTVQIGIKILQRIQNLHANGYIHSDIRLSSISLAQIQDRNIEDEKINGFSQVFLTNLGNAKAYLDTKGTHVPNEIYEDSIHHLFSSKNVLAKHKPSRRDDIIMLIYVMVFLRNRFQEIKKVSASLNQYKALTNPNHFCMGTPFGPLLEEAYSYLYDEQPNYSKLQHLMKIILITESIKPSSNFSWRVDAKGDDKICEIPLKDLEEQKSVHRCTRIIK